MLPQFLVALGLYAGVVVVRQPLPLLYPPAGEEHHPATSVDLYAPSPDIDLPLSVEVGVVDTGKELAQLPEDVGSIRRDVLSLEVSKSVMRLSLSVAPESETLVTVPVYSTKSVLSLMSSCATTTNPQSSSYSALSGGMSPLSTFLLNSLKISLFLGLIFSTVSRQASFMELGVRGV
eukprot:CAMPEP_0197556204 /NCGR_PEP_ID=MMETSP1320-20131121/14735_1 /TAXON_ID=91990 /ORGANISM="Bolidomonas sp., Strain RCC2347" /LENGTH=176 /DNA_ID=CAMNT_0043117311 /DNA_START=1 /DNA_END=532 /DNA_ORIENTATION=+